MPDPGNPRLSVAMAPARRDTFQVLFFDFPGTGPESWKREYEDRYSGRLPRRYQQFAKTYVHPFIRAIRGQAGSAERYELVLQYWFFYPFNDGGNNHEGDWEHINVVVAPFALLGRGLTESDVRGVLAGQGLESAKLERPFAPDALVIERVEYYFHHQVMVLDLATPNAYLPHAEWERAVRALAEQRVGERWYWERARYYAYLDADESRINTHAIGYIGADNEGTDQILSMPGGKNRDSHGTYPFPGLYKNVGPAGAAEQLSQSFDHRELASRPASASPAREPRFRRGHAERFDDLDKIRIIPDWERVVDLVRESAEARREWAWLVLPIRWGYPATESPFAGVISHVETGNLGALGPAFNSAWNRAGPTAGYDLYEPHRFSALLPTTWQDGFQNDLGFLNLTLPTLIVLPPFDFLWRAVAIPFRAAFKKQHPVFYPTERIPDRFVGLAAGVSVHLLEEDFSLLFANARQVDEILLRLVAKDTLVDVIQSSVEDAVSTHFQVNFFLGDRFVSENGLRHSRSDVRLDFLLFNEVRVVPLEADLNFWEYTGTLRYNLASGKLLPFLKAGYGLSWYRLENATLDGDPLVESNGPWVRRPSIFPFGNLLPNTWHVGAGLEFLPIRNVSGLDIGLRADFVLLTHKLGLDLPATFVSPQFGVPVDLDLGTQDVRITRPSFNVMLKLSY